MQVASLRARLLATLAEAAVVILGIAAVVGLGVGGAVAYARLRGTNDEHQPDQDEAEEDASPLGLRCDRNDVGDPNGSSREIQARIHEFLQTPRVQSALWGASAGLAVAGRNWRSPGYRMLGLRRVDARTGGAISVRSALVGFLFDRAWRAAAGRLFRSRVRREQDRMSELAPKLREIERTHATDPQAHERAMNEVYRANALRPHATCGWMLAGPILSQLVLAIWIRNGRTVYDRLTGTIVVRDR